MPPSVEIAIPTTFMSSTNPPHTLFNITLRLPLRSFTIQKRYSCFVSLHSSLLSSVSTSPPAPLPPKSWLTRTTSSPALTETRRIALEAYLVAINTSADARWRSTPAWRAFLNLPSSNMSANSSSAAAYATLTSRAGGGGPITDPTVWLDCHRDLKTQLHDARLHLQRRDQAESVQGQHESGSAAKGCLIRAGGIIGALEEGLKIIAELGKGGGQSWETEGLGAGELRRRRDLVGSAKMEKEGLEALMNLFVAKGLSGGVGMAGAAGSAASERDKSGLFEGVGRNTGRSGRVLGAPVPETERTRELENQGVLQLQKQMMAEQDLDVEMLGKGVSRLKELGVAINGELEVQNSLLKLLDDDTERVEGKVKVAKKRIGKIS